LLQFSASPSEASILKAFSMTEDGTKLEGRFSFEDRDLWFFPVNGIREGRGYHISVTATAEDRQGNSLEEDFHREFFTRAEGEAPRVRAILPADGSILAQAPAEIRLFFSEPVDPVSLEGALRIDPSPSHVIRWEADYREAVILPVKPLSLGVRYTVSVSTALLDRSRNSMILPFTGSFLLGDDRSAPGISLAWLNPEGGGNLVSGGPNAALPLDAEFDISFTRNVEIESLAGYLEVQPSLGISVRGERDSRTRARISLSQKPVWGETYTLTVRKGIGTEGGDKTAEDLVFPLTFDAPRYMPPRFLRGFFDAKDSVKILGEETDFDSLALEVTAFPTTGAITATELCLVFAVSQEASSLAPSSAMGSLSISATNACAYVSIKQLRVLDESSYRAGPFNDAGLTAGPGKKLCALVYGLEIENTVQPGLLVFLIRSSLEDSLGNALGSDVTITWNKA
jgi:hypothetical protein